MAGTDEYAPTFALIDTDQDGFISAGEFKKLLDVLGGGSGADERAAAMFAQMDGDAKLELTLTQDELAAFIGASRVSVNRVLGDLERREIIEIRRRHIVVRDPEKLAKEIRV